MIGYGKYRINIYKLVGSNFTLVNHCYVDYSHGNYPWNPGPNGLTNDIFVYYLGNGDIRGWDQIYLPADRTLKIWDQRRSNNPNAFEEQNKNGFHSTNSGINFQWLKFPLIASEYQGPTEETPEKLLVHLDVFPNHHPKVKCGETFSIESGSRLLLQSTNNGANYSQFTVGEYPGSNCCAC